MRRIKRMWFQFHSDRLVKLKLKFVSWFDAKYPGKYCWDDCVAWAYSPRRFNPYKIENSKGCETESKTHDTESCYCGGWVNGKCYALLTEQEKSIMLAEREKQLEFNDDLPF